MYKTSDFLARKVLCLENATIIGNVQDVLFSLDGKQAFYLSISRDSSAKLLPFDKIVNVHDTIVIDCEAILVCDYDIDSTSLISLDGKEIFSQSGERKGNVDYVEIFASGKTNKIVAGDAAFSPSAFQTCGDVLLLKTTKKRAKSPRIPRDKSDRKVEMFDKSESVNIKTTSNREQTAHNDKDDETMIATAHEKNDVLAEMQDIVLPKPPVSIEQGSPLFSQDALEKIVGKEVVYDENTDEKTPARIISDYDFLLGRTLLRNLTTYAGTLIAAQGTVINKELVETASRHGKLVELTLNSSYK